MTADEVFRFLPGLCESFKKMATRHGQVWSVEVAIGGDGWILRLSLEEGNLPEPNVDGPAVVVEPALTPTLNVQGVPVWFLALGSDPWMPLPRDIYFSPERAKSAAVEESYNQDGAEVLVVSGMLRPGEVVGRGKFQPPRHL